jgi:hypothetical protein
MQIEAPASPAALSAAVAEAYTDNDLRKALAAFNPPPSGPRADAVRAELVDIVGDTFDPMPALQAWLA